MTTDTFTNAQGRRFVAGQEVPEVVWERVQYLADEIESLRSVVRQAHDTLNLQFHTIVWNRLTPEQIAAVDRALNP